MTIPVSTINFRAEAQKIGQPNNVNYNNRYTAPMPENALNDDVFMMQAMAENQAEKRAKSQDRWNKAGVLAQIGIATGFIATAAVGVLGLFGIKHLTKNGAKEAAKQAGEEYRPYREKIEEKALQAYEAQKANEAKEIQEELDRNEVEAGFDR